MKHSWEKISLGELQKQGLADVQTGPFGTVLKASEYTEEGVPVISVGEIREGFLQITERTPMVSESVTTRLPQFILTEGDIVFGRKGAIDRNSLINAKQEGWFLGSDAIRLRLSREINSVFISYQLRSKNIGKWLLQNSSGSIMASLNQKVLDRLPLMIPEKPIQDRIAETLSALDSKISLNNRINAELEAMAKTIYDYWFVQFDFPMSSEQAAAIGRPAAAGKPYKSSGGEMVWNEKLKREVPKGWEVKSLGNEIEVLRGISYKSSEIKGGGVPMINLNSFKLDGTYKDSGIKWFSGKFAEKNKIVQGDLLIAATDVTRNADIIGKAILVPDYREGGVFSMDIAKVIPSENLSSSYLKMLFNTKHYHDYIKYFASGTIVLHLNMNGMKWYKAEIPPKELLDSFDALYQPIAQRITETTKHNQELASLRDWLLPMLMNGQVKVGEHREEYEQDGEVGIAAEGDNTYNS